MLGLNSDDDTLTSLAGPEGGLCCCVKIGFHDVTGAEHASLQERERHGSALQGFLRNRRAHSFLYTRSARGFQETPIRDDSIDSTDDSEKENFPIKFLNSITLSGMPCHKLKLRVGAIIMLLRNLNTEVLTGSAEGEAVLIPRIDLSLSDIGLPFKLIRGQFPVMPAFAMTINKSQGQTLDRVGIFLPEPVFAHGDNEFDC
ncbi:hypothetical protein QTO34_013124 [Cnephaeus nilssonii]|uniref:DNA helicase Pif1-like 2B domain-containing protein n=1 Tax=Cnephaeus nilssonii TaxID=3371016 RepID=A0AA40LST2_CNENI|nr:hypothetical protein QTO34_013124 [Eptesicus nilssonii]